MTKYDKVIAASAHSSVSLWDTTTLQQLGSTITYSHPMWFMDISPNGDIATAGEKTVTHRKLCDLLPSPDSHNFVSNCTYSYEMPSLSACHRCDRLC